MAILKPDQNLMIKRCHDPNMDIYNFGMDEERISHNNDEVHIDDAESAEEAHGGGMLETGERGTTLEQGETPKMVVIH